MWQGSLVWVSKLIGFIFFTRVAIEKGRLLVSPSLPSSIWLIILTLGVSLFSVLNCLGRLFAGVLTEYAPLGMFMVFIKSRWGTYAHGDGLNRLFLRSQKRVYTPNVDCVG